MATLRYVIALMLVCAVPAAIGYWLAIHPLARLWRRMGQRLPFIIPGSFALIIMAGMYLLRHRLLAADWGGNVPGAICGVTLLAASLRLLRELRRDLPLSVMLGIPELSGENPGRLIRSGLYARVRHPRYGQMTLALTGYALIANYPAGYGALLFWCAGIWLVTFLEERELVDRFGEPYREYCRSVPRFIPRLFPPHRR